MDAVVNILCEKKRFLPFFSEKMDRKSDRGTPENGDMRVFFYQNPIFYPYRCFS